MGAALTTTERVGTTRRPGTGKRDGTVYVCRNQWSNPRKSRTGSNLVDLGRAAAHADLVDGDVTPTPATYVGQEAIGEGLRRTRGEAAGEELGADPADWHMVNAGTVPVPPFPPPSRGGDGRAHRRLRASGWGGGSVVVRGRESRPHGEGTQRVRSAGAEMSGARR